MVKPNDYMDRVPYRFHNKSDNPFVLVITNKWFIIFMMLFVIALFMFGDKLF